MSLAPAPSVSELLLTAQFGFDAVQRLVPGEHPDELNLFGLTIAAPIVEDARCAINLEIAVDFSGSMGDVIDRVRETITWLLCSSGLDGRDQFSITIFSDGVDVVAALRPLTKANAVAALALLARFVPGGGTNLCGAVAQLMRSPVDPARPTLAIVITDGEPSAEYGGPVEIIRQIMGDSAPDTDANGAGGGSHSSASTYASTYASTHASTSMNVSGSLGSSPPRALRRTHAMMMGAPVVAPPLAPPQPIARSLSVNIPDVQDIGTQADDDYEPFAHHYPAPQIAVSDLRRAELLVCRGAQRGHAALLSVIGIGRQCNDRLQELMARAGGGVSKAVVDFSEAGLRLSLAELIAGATSITHRTSRVTIEPAMVGAVRCPLRWHFNGSTVLCDAVTGALSIDLPPMRSGEAICGSVRALGVFPPGTTLGRVRSGASECALRLPARVADAPAAVAAVHWISLRTELLDRIGDALAAADRRNALIAVQAALEVSHCRALAEAAPIRRLIESLIADGGRAAYAPAYASLSLQRTISGSAPVPTKFARTLTQSASQI